MRQPQDSNLRRHDPVDFKSSTRPGCHLPFSQEKTKTQ